MSEEFRVDLDQLDGLVTHLSNLVGLLGERLDDLDQRSAAVHAGAWAGAAATAHEVAHREWVAGAREFGDGVAAMSAALRQAHGHYSTAQTLMARCCAGVEPSNHITIHSC